MKFQAGSIRALALIAFTFTFIGLASQPAAAAEPQFKWLCKPGRAGDPCVGQPGSLLTAQVDATSAVTTSTPKALPRLSRRVDCFYVYPTVSGQSGLNATLTEDPEISGIAVQQASRFTPGCRMFAPIYKQFTVSTILGSLITPEVENTAYQSVKSAWNEYITKYNKGRGIVLIGHSQGAGHLTHLIQETFDRKPNLRKRLVSAVLVGGNVSVRKGSRVGGSFKKVPSCSKAGETGCVIAYSSFLELPPPDDAFFGRVGGALSEDLDPDTYEVMCVNPARLDGSKGILKPLYSTAPFPGIYGPLLPDFTGIQAPWASFPDLYSANCQKTDRASWLNVHVLTGESDARPKIGEPLGRIWGTHLTEVNDASGNLVSIVNRQEAAWVKKADREKKAANRKKNKQKKNKQKK